MTASLSISELSESGTLHQLRWRDGKVAWRMWGNGPAVVLLHGGFGSWTHWIRTIPALAEERCVIVPDMPGFGDSDDFSMEDAGEEIAEALLDGLARLVDIDNGIDVVGFSFGTVIAGTLAAKLAASAPGALRSLVLTAPAGLGIPSRNFAGLRSSSPDMSVDETRDMHRHNLGVVMIADPSRITEETIDLQIANTTKKRRSGKPYSRTGRLLEYCPDLPLKRVHIILGEQDSYVQQNQPEYGRALEKLHPALRIHRIQDGGHWVQYECPRVFNEILTNCLEETGI